MQADGHGVENLVESVRAKVTSKSPTNEGPEAPNRLLYGSFPESAALRQYARRACCSVKFAHSYSRKSTRDGAWSDAAQRLFGGKPQDPDTKSRKQPHAK
jgi:hypothetical protein